MTRSLATLSSEDVLALAIRVEQANAERFRTFGEVFRGYDPKVTHRFEELAQEEETHEKLLLARFKERFGDHPLPPGDIEVPGVIEAADLDEGEHLIFDSLSERRIYELALAAERGAQDFYRKAAKGAADPALASLYRELADMEDGHASFLEDKLRKP